MSLIMGSFSLKCLRQRLHVYAASDCNEAGKYNGYGGRSNVINFGGSKGASWKFRKAFPLKYDLRTCLKDVNYGRIKR